MTFDTFTRLATVLRPYIIAASGQSAPIYFVPNGPISPDVRLACAICWFAGGSLYNIMTTYGIGHTDAMNSCWYVVDAVNIRQFCSSPKKKNCGRPKLWNHDEVREAVKLVPLYQRRSIRDLAAALGMPKSTLHETNKKRTNQNNKHQLS
jgi:hypothetical protein